MTMQVKASEVADLIPNGSVVVSDGMTMMGVADEAFKVIEDSYNQTGAPHTLTWVHAAGQSNRSEGLARVAHEGLLKRVIGSHWGLNPPMANLLGQNKVEAVCLPQGQLSTLFRTIAAKRPGQISTVGIGTYIDPRLDGGRINDKARANIRSNEYVELMEIQGEEFLFYKSFPLDVALIRGDSIDKSGNLSHREEVSGLDALAIAQAVHNSGGKVIAQVKKIVENGEIDARDVVVPSPLIDYYFVTTDSKKYHKQSHSFNSYNPDLTTGYMSSEKLSEAFSLQETPENRLSVGLRGAELVENGDVINVGTGIPADTIGKALAKLRKLDKVYLTVESGTYNGLPLGVVDFGCSIHPSAIIGHPQQMDFYNGGGVDITFMGAGEIDENGNINVSFLGGRAIGCGGFMDIVDGAKKVCFLASVSGRHNKFVNKVSQISFAGKRAINDGRQVFLATEFYLLKLTLDGWKVVDKDNTFEAYSALKKIPFYIEEA